MATNKYAVLSPIKTSEGIVSDGFVDVDDKEVDKLQAEGVIGEQFVEPTLTDDQKLDAVKQAIVSLNVDNVELWTKDGKPNAASITEIVGFSVSAALRDKAWDIVKPAPQDNTSKPQVGDANTTADQTTTSQAPSTDVITDQTATSDSADTNTTVDQAAADQTTTANQA